MTIDAATNRAQLASTTISEGDWVSVDGDSGGIYLGQHEIIVERPDAELAEIERWRGQAQGAGHERKTGHSNSAS
jgi:pyruvate,orthophosphate dikinase